jgi:hypothetical protein
VPLLSFPFVDQAVMLLITGHLSDFPLIPPLLVTKIMRWKCHVIWHLNDTLAFGPETKPWWFRQSTSRSAWLKATEDHLFTSMTLVGQRILVLQRAPNEPLAREGWCWRSGGWTSPTFWLLKDPLCGACDMKILPSRLELPRAAAAPPEMEKQRREQMSQPKV